MISEATPTQDLIATFSNARPLSEVSFEEGCTVLDAIELFDHRPAGGKLGTLLEYRGAGRNALRFVPTCGGGRRHRLVCEKLAHDVDTYSATLKIGAAFIAWVVIDRTTRVTWVECCPVQGQRPLHPRVLREACEFPSSSRGPVSAHVFLRKGTTWSEVIDSVRGTYHAAKDLLDQLDGCDHRWDQDVDAARKLLHGEAESSTDLHAPDGVVGLRTSQLPKPVHIRTLPGSGVDSVDIDLDDGDAK